MRVGEIDALLDVILWMRTLIIAIYKCSGIVSIVNLANWSLKKKHDHSKWANVTHTKNYLAN